MSKEIKLPLDKQKEFPVKNKVVREFQSDDLLQLRLSMLVLSTIDDESKDITYTLTPSDYARFTESKAVYNKIKDLTIEEAYQFKEQMKAFKTSIEIGNLNGLRTYREILWFDTAEYTFNPETKKVVNMKFKLSSSFLEYVRDMKKNGNFTLFQTGTILALNNPLSMMLYQSIISRENLIYEANTIRNAPFDISMSVLREEVGFDAVRFDENGHKIITPQKYLRPHQCVQQFDKAIDHINRTLKALAEEIDSGYTTSFKHKTYYVERILYTHEKTREGYIYHFCLQTRQKEHLEIENASVQQLSAKSVYSSDLAAHYKRKLKQKRCGAKLISKFEDCCGRGIDIKILSDSIDELAAHPKLVIGNEKQEQALRRLIDRNIIKYSHVDCPDILYESAVTWFAMRACHMPPFDKQFQTTLSKWFVSGMDIRIVLSGILKTKWAADAKTEEEIASFKWYAYVTKTVNVMISSHAQPLTNVEHLTTDVFMLILAHSQLEKKYLAELDIRNPKLILEKERTLYARTCKGKETKVEYLKSALNLDRDLTERETEYLLWFDKLGFDDSAVAFASEIAREKISPDDEQYIGWEYMQALLQDWDKKNWHTGSWIRSHYNKNKPRDTNNVDENGMTKQDKEWLEEFRASQLKMNM